MKTLFSIFIALTLFLVGLPAQSEAFDFSFWSEGDLILYDDFLGKGIDPEKWFGESTIDSTPSAIPPRFELVARDSMVERGREVKWGRLVMFGRSFGDTYSDSRRVTYFRERMKIQDPPASNVTAMKVSLMVLEANTKACPENGAAARAFFRAMGFFFNAPPGSSYSSVENYDGDVFAFINVERQSDSHGSAGRSQYHCEGGPSHSNNPCNFSGNFGF